MDNLFSLENKNILITGATGGLGQAIAIGLATYGGNIIALGRNEAKLNELQAKIEKQTNRHAHIIRFDLNDIDAIPDMFGQAIKTLSHIDILINCAGINKRAPAEHTAREDWDDVLRINLSACFFLSQEFCKHRKELSAGGKIVNIGSLMCKVARPTTTPYAASKGGLLMLTRSLACEWAKYQINVNAIGPGYFLTEMTKKLQSDVKFNEWVIQNTPLGRWGIPDDLIGAAVFLSSAASDFITGQIIYVDGGWLSLV